MKYKCWSCKNYFNKQEVCKAGSKSITVRYVCLQCNSKRATAYYHKNIEKERKKKRAWQIKNKDKVYAYWKKWLKNKKASGEYGTYMNKHYKKSWIRTKARLKIDPQFKEKISARKKVGHQLKIGRLSKKPCSMCGNPEVQAHHEDYSKPLDVIWLCRKHHFSIHLQKVAKHL